MLNRLHQESGLHEVNVQLNTIRTAEALRSAISTQLNESIGDKGPEEVVAFEESKAALVEMMRRGRPPCVGLINRATGRSRMLDVPEQIMMRATELARSLWESAIELGGTELAMLYLGVIDVVMKYVAQATSEDAFERGIASKDDFDEVGMKLADSIAVLDLCKAPDSVKAYHLLLESGRVFGTAGTTAELHLMFESGLLVPANADQGEQHDRFRKMIEDAVALSRENGKEIKAWLGPWFFRAQDQSLIGLIYTRQGFIPVPMKEGAFTNPFLTH